MSEIDYESSAATLVDKLIAAGEAEVHEESVPLSDVAGRLNGNPKACSQGGSEGAEP